MSLPRSHSIYPSHRHTVIILRLVCRVNMNIQLQRPQFLPMKIVEPIHRLVLVFERKGEVVRAGGVMGVFESTWCRKEDPSGLLGAMPRAMAGLVEYFCLTLSLKGQDRLTFARLDGDEAARWIWNLDRHLGLLDVRVV